MGNGAEALLRRSARMWVSAGVIARSPVRDRRVFLESCGPKWSPGVLWADDLLFDSAVERLEGSFCGSLAPGSLAMGVYAATT